MLYEQIRDRVSQAVEAVKKKLSDAKADGNLTPSELWSVAFRSLVEVLSLAIELLQVIPASGQDKKAAAIEAALAFYRDIIKPLDIPFLPNFIIEPLVDDGIENAIPSLVGGLIDGLHRVMQQSPLPPAPPVE